MREALLIIHFIGLAMAVGTGFAMTALGIATGDMEPPERGKYMLRAFILTKVGSIGFVLLIASGIPLVWPLWAPVSQNIAWWVKLGLIVVQAGLLGFMQSLIAKAKREQGGPVMAKIPKVGRAMFFTGLAIVIAAVLTFK